MGEITEAKLMFSLSIAVRNHSVRTLQDTNVILNLRQAWELMENLYLVHIDLASQWRLDGLLVYQGEYNSQLFLDSASILILAQMRIDASIQNYNDAPHDPWHRRL